MELECHDPMSNVCLLGGWDARFAGQIFDISTGTSTCTAWMSAESALMGDCVMAWLKLQVKHHAVHPGSQKPIFSMKVVR